MRIQHTAVSQFHLFSNNRVSADIDAFAKLCACRHDGLRMNLAHRHFAGSCTFAAGSLVLDSDVQWWGAGVVQRIDAAAMDLYVGYRQYEANATISGGPANQIPGGLNDIWFIQAGARIQF